MLKYLRIRGFMFLIAVTTITGLFIYTRGEITTAAANVSPVQTNTTQTPMVWRQYQDNPDLARRGMAAVFDTHRQVVVMFGGEHMDSMLDETWEFDGTDWGQVSPPHSPPGRLWHGLAYDSDRQVAILFGGTNDQTVFNDTWEYDGSDWVKVTTSEKPQPLSGFGMAYDTCRQKTVLFSGYENWGTWEYDGTNWEEIPVSHSPEYRHLAAMTFDKARCRTVLFGGMGGGAQGRNDTWEYDGVDWVQVQTANSPFPRWASALAYDPVRAKTILFGGYGPEYPNGDAFSDTWEYDGVDWLETSPDVSPSAREQHILVYESKLEKMFLFGGFGNGDTWFYGYQYSIYLPQVVR
jgi:hypothetical protein